MKLTLPTLRGNSSRTKIIAGTALLSSCLVVAFVLMVDFSYRNAMAEQGTSLRNLSFAFSAQTQGTMQLIEQLMSEAEVLYREETRPGRDGVARKGDNPHIKGPLNDNLLDISVLDRNGRPALIYSTGKGAGEADPTLAGFRAEVRSGIDLTVETSGREPRNAILKFGRPFIDASGVVVGTIVVRIDASELQQLYETIDVGTGGSVTLIRLDGQMLVRGPALPGWIGRNMAGTQLFKGELPRAEHGFFQTTSPVDGVVRLYGYDVVADYPLVVVVGMDKWGTLALWVRWVRITVVLVLVLLVFLGLLGWMLTADAARKAHQARYDDLTGLPNFFHFRTELHRLLKEGTPGQADLHLLLVSLGRLGEIGKLCGREAGDGAIRSAGALLRERLRAECFVGRTKYDEFGIFFADTGPEAARKCAAQVFALLSAPVEVNGIEFYLGPVIGVAQHPRDTQSSDELLRFADTAMHQAGTEGQGQIKFFKSDDHGQLAHDLMLEGLLHRAIQKGELRLVYQPKVDAVSSAIMGWEALLRWNTPGLGEISPMRFIPIAEKTDLIIRIGAWVLDAACRQAARWEHDFGRPVRVAVNLSLQQFHQEDLVEMIRTSLAAAPLDPASLELEITESTVMSRGSDLDLLMRKIRALGVTLSIDDFGTGYSSLAHVKRFPAQTLKIDRSFITDLAADKSSLAIVQSIIALAHGLHLKVVAEGVETEVQLEILRGLGCDEFQGYLFSRPLETTAAEALMRAAWPRTGVDPRYS